MTSPLDNPAEETAGPAVPSHDQLDRSLVGGVAWTAGVKWLSQILTWPATFIVVRLLAPEDYGIVAMGSVYIGLVNLVNEFGLGSAIIKDRALTDRQIAQINGLCVLFGFAGFSVTIAAAYPLAVFYHTPAVRFVVIALSINFFITSLKTVPLSLLQRDFEFRRSAINEAAGAIVQSTALVLFAFLGFKYWSLVIAFLLSSLTTTVLSYVQRPHAIAWPVTKEIKSAITFGGHLVGSRIGWYLYTNADFFIVGSVLGQVALGAYSFGWTFATAPLEKVTSLIGRVSPPIFSAVQNESAALRRYVASLTSGIVLLTVPAGIGLALVTRDFVVVALGDRWLAAVDPLRLLALFAAARSVVPVISQAGTNIGLAKEVMYNSIASAIVMPLAFLIGSHWGTSGVAAAWLVAYPVVALPLFRAVFKRIEMRVPQYLRALWPAVSSTAVMIPAVLLAKFTLTGWPAVARLAVEVVAGAITYIGAVRLLHPAEFLQAFRMVRGLRDPEPAVTLAASI